MGIWTKNNFGLPTVIPQNRFCKIISVHIGASFFGKPLLILIKPIFFFKFFVSTLHVRFDFIYLFFLARNKGFLKTLQNN